MKLSDLFACFTTWGDIFVFFQILLYLNTEVLCIVEILLKRTKHFASYCGVFLRFCIVITWHLHGWKDICHFSDHCSRETKSCCKALESPSFNISRKMKLSSANNMRLVCYLYRLISMEVWGIPDVKWPILLICPSGMTFWVVLHRQFSKHVNSLCLYFHLQVNISHEIV